MFTENLLESSPEQTPVLTAVHWFISLVVGALAFAGAYFALGWISEGAETRVLITQSSIVGIVLFFYALMICYVYSDTRHLGFSTMLWLIITVPLNLVGFLIYLIYSAARTGNWKRATIPAAYILEAILIGVMVLIPLIYTEALPKAQLMGFLVSPPPPPPPPPPPAAAPVRVIRRVTVEDIMKAPTVIPKTITPIKDQPEPPPQQAAGVVGGVPGGVPGGTAGGVIGGIIGGVLSSAPPPPPKATTPKRIRVGGQVENAKQIFAPKPEYPPLAKMARIQGAVKLEAIISKDGTIQDLKILSGHPLLVKAAVEAVSRWRYQPTLLNGEPVEVITEIDVNFTLAE
jgi:periplasmic protein TonB